jgi:hypothetical protein
MCTGLEEPDVLGLTALLSLCLLKMTRDCLAGMFVRDIKPTRRYIGCDKNGSIAFLESIKISESV